MPKPSNNLSRSTNTKKDWSASSLSPISKLMGNRPAAVQSLVSKVEAISFEGIPPAPSDHHHHHHHHQQPSAPDSTSVASRPSSLRLSPSPQGSPTFSLTNSPNLNEATNPHVEDFVRDTPTIRQLKTSLRSRLQTDSDRHQKRSSEDSGRSDAIDHHHHRSANSSPHRLKPASLKASQNQSLPNSHHKDISSSDRSSSHNAHSQRSSSAFPSHESSDTKGTQVGRDAGVSAGQQGCDVSFDPSCSPSEQPIQSAHSTIRPRAPTNLPDLRIPLINISLSPPKLALWSVEAYDCEGKTNFVDVIAHLVMLPLHTALAIMKKLPFAGNYLNLNPLFSQAEKEQQGILLTASQMAIGLTLASGWKVARRILA
ncbi:hypothetical protein Pst134EA_007886 [Puccinia striiformis f. sp. tritici]|uniref:hypothetical protein n=1 Tax=Puccinia striiformis f. sp. tritici TaxID=168172 RepID=UPI0020081027|nr:hypothetical protein Pst134EA_007886 [Puccinia striiformis f. sp. tritici]KAH9470642.1 hypothetical protein Pst134EA_007886 [Puccinia striiformis f. sp. tritici]